MASLPLAPFAHRAPAGARSSKPTRPALVYRINSSTSRTIVAAKPQRHESMPKKKKGVSLKRLIAPAIIIVSYATLLAYQTSEYLSLHAELKEAAARLDRAYAKPKLNDSQTGGAVQLNQPKEKEDNLKSCEHSQSTRLVKVAATRGAAAG